MPLSFNPAALFQGGSAAIQGPMSQAAGAAQNYKLEMLSALQRARDRYRQKRNMRTQNRYNRQNMLLGKGIDIGAQAIGGGIMGGMGQTVPDAAGLAQPGFAPLPGQGIEGTGIEGLSPGGMGPPSPNALAAVPDAPMRVNPLAAPDRSLTVAAPSTPAMKTSFPFGSSRGSSIARGIGLGAAGGASGVNFLGPAMQVGGANALAPIQWAQAGNEIAQQNISNALNLGRLRVDEQQENRLANEPGPQPSYRENLLAQQSPEDQARAGRIFLGLEPKAAAPKPVLGPALQSAGSAVGDAVSTVYEDAKAGGKRLLDRLLKRPSVSQEKWDLLSPEEKRAAALGQVPSQTAPRLTGKAGEVQSLRQLGEVYPELQADAARLEQRILNPPEKPLGIMTEGEFDANLDILEKTLDPQSGKFNPTGMEILRRLMNDKALTVEQRNRLRQAMAEYGVPQQTGDPLAGLLE